MSKRYLASFALGMIVLGVSQIATAENGPSNSENGDKRVSAEVKSEPFSFIVNMSDEACTSGRDGSASKKLKEALELKCAEKGFEHCKVTSMAIVSKDEIRSFELFDTLPLGAVAPVMLPIPWPHTESTGKYTCTMKGFAKDQEESEASSAPVVVQDQPESQSLDASNSSDAVTSDSLK